MAKAAIDLPPGVTHEQVELFRAIQAGLGENDYEISLVKNALNKGIAQLAFKNTKVINDLQGQLLKSIDAGLIDNDNIIDGASTALLGWTQSALDDTQQLLTQLAASTGLTSPGDPLEAALTQKLADQPDMAYSASLFLALREAMPHLGCICKYLERIAVALEGSSPSAPSSGQGDLGTDGGGVVVEPVKTVAEPDFAPTDDVSLDDSPLPPDDSEGSEAS
jgi:hypothetical protein